ncbi:Diadenosine 5',5'''-P1,P4-tetraphosphate phosphorylase 2 [Porphyridium purpureum]|uniref:Diadenosine 5',5'''-P1,P4-tetraphosphate phosphorylase 2 n=1 Tax=Porphyridium purpureum TaxID=35688 RepID=A0A5J4Z5Y7_PORPP|nr:Diadenosine 5',5'''-P1,P4-tetraphosphate phosphorylase 2 [Porphyridium purpureum]|eukprot:POR9012..scf295_1
MVSGTERDMSNFLDRVRAATARAVQANAIFPIDTTVSVFRQPGTELDFVIRRVANLQRKPKATAPEGNQSARPQNPFLPYDPDMFVENVSETHVVLLNKFNVIEDHVLLVTRAFEPQSALLTERDFDAVIRVLRRMDGVAFYNAGTLAGASQFHKHLQVVPRLMPDQSERTPFCISIRAAMQNDSTGPLVVAGLDFEHVVEPVIIQSTEDDCSADSSAATLLSKYHSCLHALEQRMNVLSDVDAQGATGIAQPFAYNLLLTREWMMVVPRSQEMFDDISVNSLGFAGALLVKNDPQLARVLQVTPMAILTAVGFLRQSS